VIGFSQSYAKRQYGCVKAKILVDRCMLPTGQGMVGQVKAVQTRRPLLVLVADRGEEQA